MADVVLEIGGVHEVEVDCHFWKDLLASVNSKPRKHLLLMLIFEPPSVNEEVTEVLKI